MNDAQHIERVLQDAVDESDFDCIALSGGLDSTILAHLASSKNPLALAVAADGFDASDLEFSKLAAKNCNLNLKLLRPDADELVSYYQGRQRGQYNQNLIHPRHLATRVLYAEHRSYTVHNLCKL